MRLVRAEEEMLAADASSARSEPAGLGSARAPRTDRRPGPEEAARAPPICSPGPRGRCAQRGAAHLALSGGGDAAALLELLGRDATGRA